ncbi:conserved hypothetical protein [Histoplasma mississippiense (nom. inval.)]|uniref:conserved hypothetical protein n=1 Tax=Ajellomyces capsulatus (strain NAm1 / WU24) TaxID=2059318 RepID=UPI000157B4EB|nr:conserved hypothetical protein [Histoplasma mississippiense (nom. inval.)]EDN02569.1 conserved hypothetical protein [Histoplasma mississippiense (nom. inval.)]
MAQISPFDIPFDKLPNPRQVWVGAPGSLEEGLGKISLLTPEVVAEAAAEIKTGVRVTLGWEMTKLELANLNRQPCQHHIISLLNGLAFDDVYIMNPLDLEQSSQWDGLRHFSQPVPATDGKSAERVFYGGTTASEILNRSNDRIGMQYWARQGITGRGVLIDYASYAAKRGIKYSTFSTHQIRLSDILEISADCNLTFKRGDILFIRIGVTNEWDNVMTDDQKRAYSVNPKPEHAGVEATTECSVGFGTRDSPPLQAMLSAGRCILHRTQISSYTSIYLQVGEFQ